MAVKIVLETEKRRCGYCKALNEFEISDLKENSKTGILFFNCANCNAAVKVLTIPPLWHKKLYGEIPF